MAFDLIHRLFVPVVTAFCDAVNAWTKHQGFEQVDLTDATTIAWDGETQQTAKVVLGGSRTLGAISNPKKGYTYILTIVQDGTGSRTLNFSTATIYTFPGGIVPTLSTAANAVDLLTAYYDGSKMRCTLAKAFA